MAVTARMAFLYRSARTFASRWKHHGFPSAYTFGKWWLMNCIERMALWAAPVKRVACPCCGWTGPLFLTIDCGQFIVHSAECPHCHAHERQRTLYLYLKEHAPDFVDRAGKVLHFAPEQHVRKLLEANPERKIVSVDYVRAAVSYFPSPKFQTDMMAIGLASDSIDAMFCLHVLEHVPDDRKGVAEMHRILKPGGVAYIMVPFMWEWPKSIEFGAPDPTIYDHMRGYSPNDFRERLAPFVFEEIHPGSYLSADELRKYRIPPTQIIFRCTK